jgi:hypothetical protein
MKPQGIGPLTGSSDGDGRTRVVGAGRAFVVSSIGTAVVVVAWSAFETPDRVVDDPAGLMYFIVPILLAALVGVATAAWGDRTKWALISGALGGVLACALLGLIAASSVGLWAYLAGFAAGRRISTG